MDQLAASRAEWFAQLAEAIERAQRLAWQLGTRDGVSDEARELYGKLEAARLELDSLRGVGARPVQRVDSDWLRRLGWGSPMRDAGD